MNPTIKQITNEYIVFEIPSSRGGMHDVIFNRLTQEWSCTCEDYWYRKRACKHTREARKFLELLSIECDTNDVYVGETIVPSQVVEVEAI